MSDWAPLVAAGVLNDPALEDAIKEIGLLQEKVEALRRNYRHTHVGIVGRRGNQHVTNVDLKSEMEAVDIIVQTNYEIEDFLRCELFIRDVFTIPLHEFRFGCCPSYVRRNPDSGELEFMMTISGQFTDNDGTIRLHMIIAREGIPLSLNHGCSVDLFAAIMGISTAEAKSHFKLDDLGSQWEMKGHGFHKQFPTIRPFGEGTDFERLKNLMRAERFTFAELIGIPMDMIKKKCHLL